MKQKWLMYGIILGLLITCAAPLMVLADNEKHFRAESAGVSKIQFGDLELEVPAGAATQEMTVTNTDLNLDGIQKPYGFIPIGKPYKFGPHGLKFAPGKALGFRMKLTSGMIPKGYSLAAVRLFYINRETKRLEQVKDQKTDWETGYLESKLEHFSEYVPGVVAGWDGQGLNPFQDYVTNGEESVSLNGLKLVVCSPVLSLPGRGGLDLKLNRVYCGQRGGANSGPFTISSRWYWDLPCFYNDRLHLPGGASYGLTHPISQNGTRVVYDEGIVFMVDTPNTLSNNKIIYLSDGTKIQTYDTYQLITDPRGNCIRYNFGQYSYYNQMPPVTKISSIQDSAGRKINFIYENRDCAPYLVQVEQEISGSSPKVIMTHSSAYRVESFTDALGRTTTYYLTGTSTQENPTNKNYDIERIDYPNGVCTEYSYYETLGTGPYEIDEIGVSVQKFYRRGENTPYRVVNYAMTDIAGDRGTTTVNDQTRIKKYIFNNWGHTASEFTYDLNNKLQKSVSYTYPILKMLIIQNSSVVATCDFQGSRPSQVTTIYGKQDGTNGLASTYQYQYDNWGNTTKITDPGGNITYMAYANTNSEKNLSNIDSRYQNAKYPSGFPASSYNLLLTKATLITAPGRSPQLNQTHYKYDGEGNLVTESVVYNSSCLDTVYTYDEFGNVLTKTDAKYNTLNFAYSTDYQSAYLTRVYKPDGTTLATYAYDFNLGKKTSATDPKGNSFSYTYDAMGRLTKETLNNSDPKVGVSRVLVYDDTYSTVTLFYGNTAGGWQAGQIVYDSLFGKPILTQRKNTRLIVASTNPADLMAALTASPAQWIVIKKFDYDTNGRLKWEMDNLNHKTSYDYDPLDRVIKTTYPDGTFSEVQWDDRVVTKIDAKNNQRIEKYDILDQLIEVTEKPDTGTNYVTTYTYDSASKLINTRNPRGAETVNFYDNLSRLVQTDYPPDGPNPVSSEIYTYDEVGNLKTKIQGGRSKVIDYEFFAGYRIRQVTTQPDNRTVSYTYDNNDNLLTQTWPGGSYTYSGYDARNRAHNLTARLDSNTFNFSYDYDTFGRTTSISYPGRTNPVTYNYDELDRLSTIPGFITSCGYDGNSKLTSMVYANGITNSYTYKTINDQLLRITAGNQSTILDLNYTFDAVGNIIQMNGDKYEYDGLNRLTWAGNLPSSDLTKTGTVWSYDPAGNFLGKFVYSNGTAQSNISGASDLANRLKSLGPISLSYDNYGDCTSKTKANVTWNYAYDSESRLTEVRKNNAIIETNTYDGNGMRVKRTNGSQTTYYLYSGANCLLEYTVTGGYKFYIYAGTQQIGEEKGSTVKYYHPDHLGSVRVMTDAAGNVTRRKNYEPYGEEKPVFQDSFDTNSLANWTVTNPHGVSFTAQNGAVTITHSTADYNGDYLIKRFDTLNGVIFEFSVKLGSQNNDACSLAIESEGLNLVFFGNSFYYYYGGWQLVGWVPMEVWNNYKVIVTSKRLEIYINDQLKYFLNGSFGAKSFLAFRDYGLCSGTVVNYLDNVRVTSCDDADYNFTSKKLDQDTGLVYFGGRFYDPEIGRFISMDPAKDGANWYMYCRNNPLRYIDPDGYSISPYYLMRRVDEAGLGGGGPDGLTAGVSLLGAAALGQAIRSLYDSIVKAIDESRAKDSTTSNNKTKKPDTIDENTDLSDTSTWPELPTGGDISAKGDVKDGAPSRSKPRARGEKSQYDETGREWRPHKPDKYHKQGHWDTKGPNPNDTWENVNTNGNKIGGD